MLIGLSVVSNLETADQEHTIKFINTSPNATIKMCEALALLKNFYQDYYTNVTAVTFYIEGTPNAKIAFVSLTNNNTIFINNTYVELVDTPECARILVHESTHLRDIRNDINTSVENLEIAATQNESYFLASYYNWSEQKRQQYVNYKIASRYWEVGDDCVALFRNFEIMDLLFNKMFF